MLPVKVRFSYNNLLQFRFHTKNKVYIFTGPKAIESIVCIFLDCCMPSSFGIIAFLSTNVFPATDQNFKCLTPAVTKCVFESGRNNARNILSCDATVYATLTPKI